MRTSVLFLTLIALVLPLALGATCGDRVCDVANDECTSCSIDCHMLNSSECIGDKDCTKALGETCLSSPDDCVCSDGEVCKAARGGASAQGCYRVVCGDGQCDRGENATSCCTDCGCLEGEHCQNDVCCSSTRTCCTKDEHCADGEMCSGFRCVIKPIEALADGAACTGAAQCLSGFCVSVASGGSICCGQSEGCCSKADDCGEGLECADNVCSTPAVTAAPALIPGIPAGYELYISGSLILLVALLVVFLHGRKVAPEKLGDEEEVEEEENEEPEEEKEPEEEVREPTEMKERTAKKEEVKRAILMGEFNCPECGKAINSDWKVCPYCSADLAGEPGSSGSINVLGLDSLDDAVKSALTSALGDLSLKPKDLSNMEGFDGDLLIVVSPDKTPGLDALENVLARVRAGAGLFLVGAGGADNSNLNKITFKLGTRFNSDLVCDYEGENVTYMPFVHNTGHPVAKGVNKLRLTASCSLDVEETEDVVLYASQTSFADEDSNFVPDMNEKKGYIVVMAARDVEKGRAVLFGDANGLSRDEPDSRTLLRNTLAWLLKRDAPEQKNED